MVKSIKNLYVLKINFNNYESRKASMAHSAKKS